VPPDDEARPIYEVLSGALDPFADLFLCETMSCIREALVAATAACATAAGSRPVWVAFTLAETPGSGLRSGETVADAVRALAHLPIGAFLFNCTTPAAIDEGLRQLRPLTDVAIGAYANVFHVPDGWTLDGDVPVAPRSSTPEEYLEQARRWQELGAEIIGGCCGIGPEHIRALSSGLASLGDG
jgi:S-methylmethionine-dependent homocysteine/selenocysteine methylase